MAPGAPIYSSISPTGTRSQTPNKPILDAEYHLPVQVSPASIESNLQPLADIEEISLELLEKGDNVEAAKLFHACQKDGIFYLNLLHSDGSGSPLLQHSSSIYHLAKQVFDIPEDEKMKYDIDLFGDLKVNGYKPIGRNFGGLSGNKDGFESYAISKSTLLALAPTAAAAAASATQHAHPAPIAAALPTLRAFAAAATAVTTAILASLSASLSLPAGAGLESVHRAHAPGPDLLRLLRYAAQPPAERGAPQAPHTDLGTLTVLFAGAPGLQRWRPDRVSEEEGEEVGWEFVAPRPGCAVVNVGDGLEMLAGKGGMGPGGAVRSCVHRVVPVPGRGMGERWSFAYMVRAEEGTRMCGLRGEGAGEVDGEVLTSEDWLRKKFGALRRGEGRAEGRGVLMGRRGE